MKEVFKSNRTLYEVDSLEEFMKINLFDLIPNKGRNIEISYSTKTKILKIDYVLSE